MEVAMAVETDVGVTAECEETRWRGGWRRNESLVQQCRAEGEGRRGVMRVDSSVVRMAAAHKENFWFGDSGRAEDRPAQLRVREAPSLASRLCTGVAAGLS